MINHASVAFDGYHGLVMRNGLLVLIEEADLPLVEPYEWQISRVSKKGKYYAYGLVDGKSVTLQRHLLGLDVGDPREADHINGCTMDNRRSNLRIVTNLQNCWNRVFHKHNSTGMRGVSYNARMGRWQARIWEDGRRRSLGYHDSPEAASDAYSRAYDRIQRAVIESESDATAPMAPAPGMG